MRQTQGLNSGHPSSWRSQAWVQLVAVLLGVLPFYSSLVILQVQGDRAISFHGFIYYLRFGRVIPLVLAHYVTNALQVVVFAAQAR